MTLAAVHSAGAGAVHPSALWTMLHHQAGRTAPSGAQMGYGRLHGASSSQFHPTICRAAPKRSDYNAKRAAAECFVKTFVRSNTVLGLGSGEMVSLAIEQVGLQLAAGRLRNVVGVPACDAAAHEAAFHGVPLASLDQAKVDVAFDEVDQLDIVANAAIKGARSQPAQPQLERTRAVARRAAQFVILADGADVVTRLGGVLPVVIDGENWEEPAEELDDLFLGDAELWRRPAMGTADPRGGDNPYISPEGHNIIDIRFDEDIKLFGNAEPYAEVAREIESIVGVVAHGLLLGVASAAVISHQGGGTQVVDFKQ